MINISIIEPSVIISQGITSILLNAGMHLRTVNNDSLRNFEETTIRIVPDIVFVNTALIQHQAREFQSVRKKLPDSRWIGLAYTLTDHRIIAMLDDVIYINDPAVKITGSVQRLLSPDYRQKQGHEDLSERETDVLKLIVTGLSNREIAEKLNISTHTVITHRKNISQKTGIKSVSGLTIYAVLKELISVNDYKE